MHKSKSHLAVINSSPKEDDMATISPDGEILKEWFIQNSSHVVDLAFNLGGNPVEMKSFVSGGQSWHPKGTIFSGAGITDKNALFSYIKTLEK